MNALVRSATGVFTFTSRGGTVTKFASKHVISYVDIPNNTISVDTAGGGLRLKFNTSGDKDIAMVLLDGAMSDDVVA